MSLIQKYLLVLWAILVVGSGLVATSAKPRLTVESDKSQIVAFNQKLSDAIRKMNNAEMMAMFADDAVDLLPGMEPMVGKATITKWLDETMAAMSGIKMVTNEDEFHDIQVSGNLATEWASTHQIVQPPDGKPRIEIYGKMLLVLEKGKDGQWRIKEEMWNNVEKH